MASGNIKKVASDRGFGFIAGDDGKEYFFHRSAVEDPRGFDALTGGEHVSFEIESSPRGPRASRVRVA
jgi:CspA family cold shock protein